MSSRKSKGVPTMNSYFIPDNTVFSNLICEILWCKRWLRKMWIKLVAKIAFCGNDEISFIQRWKKNTNYREQITIDEYNYHFKGIVGTSRIILGTESLEVPWRIKFDNEEYFYSFIHRNEEKYMTKEYTELIGHINVERLLGKKIIIYCSFGTVSYKDTIRVSEFMKKLLDAKPKFGDIILVISKGKLPFDWPEMKNSYYLDYLPQLDFLNYCSLMITHGGHNSIKECYQKGVKMLVYPHMEDNDQPGNAVRVQLNNLGLMGNLKKDSSKEIWKKIFYCLNQIPELHIPR